MADVSPQGVTDWGSLVNSYGLGQANIANTQADTAVQQQRAQAAGMQNKVTAASLPLVLKAINDESAAADQSGEPNSATPPPEDPNPGDPGEPGKTPVDPGTGFNPAQEDAGVQRRYFGALQGLPSPQEQQQLMRAKLMSSNPATAGLAASLQSQVEYGISQRKVGAQTDALNQYQAMVATSNAPEGQALDILANSGPLGRQRAAAIKAQFKEPDEQDAAARVWSNHMAGVYHTFTGHGATKQDDGTWVDSETLQPIPGVARIGLTPDQERQAYQYWNDPQATPDGLGGSMMRPRWQQSGLVGGPQYQNAEDAITKNRTSGGIAPQVLQGGQQTPQQAATKQKIALAQNAARTQQVQGAVDQAHQQIRVAAARQNAKVEAQLSPTERGALADPTYKLANSPDVKSGGPGTTPNELQSPVLKDIAAEKSQLYKDSNQAIQDGASVVSYLDAASAVLKSPGLPPVGAGSATMAAINSAMHTLHMSTGDYAARHQEIAKYLGNVAWTGIKASLPPGSRLNQMEFMAAMNQLNPAVGQTDNAVGELIGKTRAMTQYRMDTAGRAQRFLGAGGDPRRFQDYNNKTWPMTDVVNAAAPPPSQERVNVVGPNGESGHIPKARLAAYLQHGWKQK